MLGKRISSAFALLFSESVKLPARSAAFNTVVTCGRVVLDDREMIIAVEKTIEDIFFLDIADVASGWFQMDGIMNSGTYEYCLPHFVAF